MAEPSWLVHIFVWVNGFKSIYSRVQSSTLCSLPRLITVDFTSKVVIIKPQNHCFASILAFSVPKMEEMVAGLDFLSLSMDLTAEPSVLPLLLPVLPPSPIDGKAHSNNFMVPAPKEPDKPEYGSVWCFYMLGLETKVWLPLDSTLVTYCDLRNDSSLWTVVAFLPSRRFFRPLHITISSVSMRKSSYGFVT